MHKQRLLVVAASTIGAISIFLPWISLTIFGLTISASGYEVWDGWVVFGLCGAAIAMALTQGDKTTEMDQDVKKKVIGFGAGIAGFMLFELVVRIGFSAAGFGAFLALLAGIGILAAPFIIKGDGSFEMPTKETINEDLGKTTPSVEETIEETTESE